jgi:hypothetical protein
VGLELFAELLVFAVPAQPAREKIARTVAGRAINWIARACRRNRTPQSSLDAAKSRTERNPGRSVPKWQRSYENLDSLDSG